MTHAIDNNSSPIKCELNIYVFYLKTDYLQLWVFYQSEFGISVAGKHIGFICDSGAAIFAWRVTWNYVHSLSESHYFWPTLYNMIWEEITTVQCSTSRKILIFRQTYTIGRGGGGNQLHIWWCIMVEQSINQSVQINWSSPAGQKLSLFVKQKLQKIFTLIKHMFLQ